MRYADSATRGLSALPGASRPWFVRLALPRVEWSVTGYLCGAFDIVPPPDLSQLGPRL